jgi:hypothetical protein
MGEGAADHGAGNVFAHSAVPLDQPDGHAEHLALRRVRIGDEAAIDHVGRAGNGGERGREQAACARLCGGEQYAAHPASLEQCRGIGDDPLVDHERVDHRRAVTEGGPWLWPWPRSLRRAR